MGAELRYLGASHRLEALAEQGKATAVTVIRAWANSPAMLTGAIGVAVRIRWPGRQTGSRQAATAVVRSGKNAAPLHTLSLAIVAALHVLLSVR